MTSPEAETRTVSVRDMAMEQRLANSSLIMPVRLLLLFDFGLSVLFLGCFGILGGWGLLSRAADGEFEYPPSLPLVGGADSARFTVSFIAGIMIL
jgi:hypothetical protein